MSEFIKFRISAEKRADYKAQAQSAGLSLTAWIISRCDSVPTTIEKPVPTEVKPVPTQAPIVPTKDFVCLLKAK